MASITNFVKQKYKLLLLLLLLILLGLFLFYKKNTGKIIYLKPGDQVIYQQDTLRSTPGKSEQSAQAEWDSLQRIKP